MGFFVSLIRRMLRRIFYFQKEADYVSEATLKHYTTEETKTGWEGPSHNGKFNR